METTSKAVGVVTPVKDNKLNRKKATISSKHSENENPNHAASPGLTSSNSPLTKSGSKSKKSASKNPNPNGTSPLLKNRIRERKFVVAKRGKRSDAKNQSLEVNLACKCSKGNGKSNKCLCVAYKSLRASQEEFFKNRGEFSIENDLDQVRELNLAEDGDDKNGGLIQNLEIGQGREEKVEGNGNGNVPGVGEDGTNELGVSVVKRSVDKLSTDAKERVPEPGSRRVMQLVNAFEKMKMVSTPKSNESEESGEKEGDNKGLRCELPGPTDPPKAPERQLSSSSFCPSELFLTSECLGLDSRRSSSLDSNRGRRSSSESFGALARRKWRKRQQHKTTAKPFKLRTEERGKCKEEEFMKKVQQMMEEEEKLRVPIAQGLPWTTDEPECLVKPPLKEATRPIDLVLHSDVRAEERAEFDHKVSEKMSLIEQYRMERDRLQKLAEEEEIRRLRKELVPKAQPMPYFDRPFIPRRSEKQPTIPKEPKFQIPQHKKIKCIQQSWSDTSSYISTTGSCYGL